MWEDRDLVFPAGYPPSVAASDGLALLLCHESRLKKRKRAPKGSATRATRPRPSSEGWASTAPPSARTLATEASTSSLCQNTDQCGDSPGASVFTSSPTPAIGQLL